MATTKKTTKTDVYSIITDRIIEAMEGGEIPWKKSWQSKTQAPRNLVSGKPYSGINVFILLSARFQSPYWLTYKQATEKGGSIKKGEKGLPIVFWSLTEKEDEKTGEAKKVGFLRYYTVFNVSQAEGLKDVPEVAINTTETDSAEAYDMAEQILNGMPNRPEIHYGHNRACYCPGTDQVQMPNKESFTSGAEFYSVIYHELSHSTLSETRLNRKATGEIRHFGDAEYSKEELIAEFSSAFLCAEANISQAVITNQAAYIQGWLKALKNDSKLLVAAAAQAQKAADYIMARLTPEAV